MRPYEAVQYKQAIKADEHATGTITGAELDCRDADVVEYVMNAGTFSATGTAAVKVQDAPAAGGSFADVVGAVFVSVAAANDDTVFVLHVRVKTGRPYQKVINVVATDVVDLGVLACIYKNNRPVTQDEAVVVDADI